MIAARADATFELFFDAWATGLLLAVSLPLLGVLLVLRRQIFLGAAVAQTGSLGIATMLWLFPAAVHAHDGQFVGEYVPLTGGLSFAVVAAFAALRTGRTLAEAEARAVWLFLAGSCGAMVLLAQAPHGMQTVQQLMLSSLLGATRADLWFATALLVVVLVVWLGLPRQLLLWGTDSATAHVHGLRLARLDVGLGALMGLALGFSIHATGLPFTFGAAVLPVLAARPLARSFRQVLLAAPVLGAGAFVLGWRWADAADLPPGQCAVLVMLAFVALSEGLAGLTNWQRSRRAP